MYLHIPCLKNVHDYYIFLSLFNPVHIKDRKIESTIRPTIGKEELATQPEFWRSLLRKEELVTQPEFWRCLF